MAATPLTLLETSNADANTLADATAGATRPTLLFGSSDTLATSATSTTNSNNTANNAFADATSPSVVGDGGGSSTASSPSFLPEMPQWKKDLIQRRKTNVARTIGASTVTPTSPSSEQQQTAAETDVELQQATVGSTLKSTTVYQKQTSIITTTNITCVERPPQCANFAKMPMSSTNAVDSPSPSRSPTKETTARGHYTPSANVSECDRQDWSHDNDADALLSPTSESTIPIPKQRSLFLSTKSHQIKDNQLPQQQELESGYPTSPTNTAGNKSPMSGVLPASGERATTTRLASSPLTSRETFGDAVVEMQEIQTTRQALQKTNKSGTYAVSERSQMQSTNTTMVGTTTRDKTTTPTGASTPLSPSTSISTLTTTATPNRLLTQQQQPAKPHQFHSKYESERTPSSGTSAHAYDECLTSGSNNLSKTSAPITAAAAFTSGCEKNTIVHGNPPATGACVKISLKLQNNQFIKQEQQQLQQQQQQLSGARYFKHKSHSLQESSGHQNVSAVAVTGSRSVSSSESISFSRSVSASSCSGAGSPTKTTASTIAPTASAIKKKMVAVQEMKKTTQNSNHHHQPVLRSHQHIMSGTTCARSARPRTPSQTNSQTDEVEFDSAEDLSYGPGIVSKLRCRYLSLAYRETMEKERLCLDNMRRATSLNNLLDRDDQKDDDEDDEEDGVDAEDEYVELCVDNDKSVMEGGILKPIAGGILKHSHDSAADGSSSASKKTATFQKHAARGTVGPTVFL